MTKARIALWMCALAGVLAIQGCTPQLRTDLMQDVGAGLARNISAEQAAQIKAQCIQAAPGLIAATAATAPAPVYNVGIFPYAFCQEFLSGKMYVDPKQESVAWLDRVLRMTATAAQIAGYVLPVVLPLL